MKKVNNFLNNYGQISVLLTVISFGVATLFYVTRMDSKITILEYIVNTHESYVEESESSRKEAVGAILNLTAQNKYIIKSVDDIATDVKSLQAYNVEQQEIIRKFYKVNEDLVDPRTVHRAISSNELVFSSTHSH